jgi:hypothetical protein
MSQLTADSMVQALLVPTATFLQLMGAVPGIRTRAWQSTAAQLAAQHHHILGQHRQLAPLNIFFRCGRPALGLCKGVSGSLIGGKKTGYTCNELTFLVTKSRYAMCCIQIKSSIHCAA